MTLMDLAAEAEFIGVVRVDGVSRRIPFVRRPQATATIIERWKGQSDGRVAFVAAPEWTCDITEARTGEEAVVFIRRGSLSHSGRGRMPLFTRAGRTLAAIWPEVRLPAGTPVEDGPEPASTFIRAVAVDVLRDAVASTPAVPSR